MNLQSQLNSPDGTWYLRVWAKNVMDNNYLTGEYLTAASSGLYTNGFYGDPRTFGVTFGLNF
jgi:outer membrane receptor protein involved in Fe transport